MSNLTQISEDATEDHRLLRLAREGDTDAYGELWREHSRAALAWARRFVPGQDAEDVAADAFVRVFEAIRSGGGPQDMMRPYLYTVIKNLGAERSRKRSDLTLDSLDTQADPHLATEAVGAEWDDGLTVKAFLALPERWRAALWYTEVEGMSPRAVAPLLSLTPNAVSSLLARAREALKEQWLREHLASTPVPAGCRPFRSKLVSYTRGSTSPRISLRIAHHLEGCERCSKDHDHLKNLNSRLLTILIPLLLGAATARSLVPGAPPSGTATAAVGRGDALAAPRVSWISGGLPSGTTSVVVGGVALLGAVVGGLALVSALAAAPQNNEIKDDTRQTTVLSTPSPTATPTASPTPTAAVSPTPPPPPTAPRTMPDSSVAVPPASAPPPAASPYRGGGFEAVSLGTYSAGADLDGWTVSRGGVQITSAVHTEGTQSIYLSNSGAGGIGQTFATVAGTTYTVSYDAGAEVGDPFIVPNTLVVRIDGAVAQSADLPSGINTLSFTFVAQGTSTTITFDCEATGGYYSYLDNIQIVG